MNSMVDYLLTSDTPLHKTISIIITLIVAIAINVFLRSLVQIPFVSNVRRGKTYVNIIRNTISLVISVFALHIIFLVLGIDITPILASAGVIGIVIGIGARSLFEDLIAGFFLTTQSTISVGDVINVGGTTEGTVMYIGLKNLTLRGSNGALIIVPNGQIKNIVNLSSGRAVNTVMIPVKADMPIDTALKVATTVLESLKGDKDYKIYPESEVYGITSLGAAITIQVNIVTSSSLRGKIETIYRHRLVKAFAEKDLSFA